MMNNRPTLPVDSLFQLEKLAEDKDMTQEMVLQALIRREYEDMNESEEVTTDE